MRITIVGGRFGDTPKSSKIVWELSKEIMGNQFTLINGGDLKSLPRELDSDLTIWMPDISNLEDKYYPHKKKGSVLICSKVMREGYTDIDAISRIFKMHGNAVIAIYKSCFPYTFSLIDALGNEWYSGSSLKDLGEKILEFYSWTKWL